MKVLGSPAAVCRSPAMSPPHATAAPQALAGPLELRIDRLVLRGVEAHHVAPLVAALREALVAELADPAARQAWMQLGHAPVSRMRLTCTVPAAHSAQEANIDDRTHRAAPSTTDARRTGDAVGRLLAKLGSA